MPAAELGIAPNAIAGVENAHVPITSPFGEIPPLTFPQPPNAPHLKGFPLVESLPSSSLARFVQEDRLEQIAQIPFARPSNEIGERKVQFIQDLVAATGLPLKVSKFDYEPSSSGYHGVLGSAVIDGINKGLVTFYRDMSKASAIEQGGVAYHEVEHTLNPFDPDNDDVYGGEEYRQIVADNIARIAQQAKDTGIFLNPYHRYIYDLHETGQFTQEQWEQLYLQETHAIVMEMAAMHPDELNAVDHMQYDVLSSLGRQDAFVPLVSVKYSTTGNVLLGIPDQIFMQQMQIEDVFELKKHFAQLRDALEDQKTPLHETQDPMFMLPEGRRIVGYIIIFKPLTDPLDELLPENILDNMKITGRRTPAT